MSTTTFHVEEWDPYAWHWGYVGELTVPSEDVRWHRSKTYDSDPMLSVALPDGEYCDGNRRVQRINFDAINVSLGPDPSRPEIVGYASVETFEDEQTPLWDGYRKMRWQVQ